MNEEICCIASKGTVKNEWENDDSDFLRALYSPYEKLGQFFYNTYMSTCLKKDTSVLLKFRNTWKG